MKQRSERALKQTIWKRAGLGRKRIRLQRASGAEITSLSNKNWALQSKAQAKKHSAVVRLIVAIFADRKVYPARQTDLVENSIQSRCQELY